MKRKVREKSDPADEHRAPSYCFPCWPKTFFHQFTAWNNKHESRSHYRRSNIRDPSFLLLLKKKSNKNIGERDDETKITLLGLWAHRKPIEPEVFFH